MKKFDRILLFSGGLDSYIAWLWLRKPNTLYFNVFSRYSKEELETINRLVPSTIIDTSLNLSNREYGDKAYIPFRNLLFACQAVHYSDTIYIIGIEDDMVSDKNKAIFTDFSNMLSKLEGREIKILSPFWEMSKVEIVAWYLKEGYREQYLFETFSCYTPINGLECRACPACFRKWVALYMNKIRYSFLNKELAETYYKEAEKYTHKRNQAIKQVVGDYYGYNGRGQ